MPTSSQQPTASNTSSTANRPTEDTSTEEMKREFTDDSYNGANNQTNHRSRLKEGNAGLTDVFGRRRSWVDRLVDEEALQGTGHQLSNIAPLSLRPVPLGIRIGQSNGSHSSYDQMTHQNGSHTHNGHHYNHHHHPQQQLVHSSSNSNNINSSSPSNGQSNTVKFVNSTVEILQNQIKKEEAPKKKRTRTTPEQLRILQKAFLTDPMPNSTARLALAKKLGMNARAVQVWFQNRRAKGKLEAKRAETGNGKECSRSAGEEASECEDYFDSNGMTNEMCRSDLMGSTFIKSHSTGNMNLMGKSSSSMHMSPSSINVAFPDYMPLGGILETNDEIYAINDISANGGLVSSPSGIGSIDFSSSGFFNNPNNMAALHPHLLPQHPHHLMAQHQQHQHQQAAIASPYGNFSLHPSRAFSFGGITGPFFDYASQDCGVTMTAFADGYPSGYSGRSEIISGAGEAEEFHTEASEPGSIDYAAAVAAAGQLSSSNMLQSSHQSLFQQPSNGNGNGFLIGHHQNPSSMTVGGGPQQALRIQDAEVAEDYANPFVGYTQANSAASFGKIAIPQGIARRSYSVPGCVEVVRMANGTEECMQQEQPQRYFSGQKAATFGSLQLLSEEEHPLVNEFEQQIEITERQSGATRRDSLSANVQGRYNLNDQAVSSSPTTRQPHASPNSEDAAILGELESLGRFLSGV